MSEVQGTVKLLRTDKGVWVSATLHSTALCICSRCLTQCRQPLRISIDEEFFQTVDVNLGTRLEVPGQEEEAFTIDERHILDITEAVRQGAIVRLPMKPLCHEECAGLCPACGSNLNEGPCRCSEAPVDSRWGSLRELLSRSQV